MAKIKHLGPRIDSNETMVMTCSLHLSEQMLQPLKSTAVF